MQGDKVKENTCEIVIACFCFLRVGETTPLVCFWGGGGMPPMYLLAAKFIWVTWIEDLALHGTNVFLERVKFIFFLSIKG